MMILIRCFQLSQHYHSKSLLTLSHIPHFIQTVYTDVNKKSNSTQFSWLYNCSVLENTLNRMEYFINQRYIKSHIFRYFRFEMDNNDITLRTKILNNGTWKGFISFIHTLCSQVSHQLVLILI